MMRWPTGFTYVVAEGECEGVSFEWGTHLPLRQTGQCFQRKGHAGPCQYEDVYEHLVRNDEARR